jgi:hypothetical protein
MFEALRQWLWQRRERRLYADMSRRINRDRDKMRTIMPFRIGEDGRDCL